MTVTCFPRLPLPLPFELPPPPPPGGVAYTEAEVTALFEEFRKEASMLLLFLKSVRTLELYDFLPGVCCIEHLALPTFFCVPCV